VKDYVIYFRSGFPIVAVKELSNYVCIGIIYHKNKNGIVSLKHTICDTLSVSLYCN